MANEKQFLDKEGLDALVEGINEGFATKEETETLSNKLKFKRLGGGNPVVRLKHASGNYIDIPLEDNQITRELLENLPMEGVLEPVGPNAAIKCPNVFKDWLPGSHSFQKNDIGLYRKDDENVDILFNYISIGYTGILISNLPDEKFSEINTWVKMFYNGETITISKP